MPTSNMDIYIYSLKDEYLIERTMQRIDFRLGMSPSVL